MLESSQRQQELESAINAYLSHADTYSITDSWDLFKSGDYAFVFGMNSCTDEENQESVYFLVPIEIEIKLLNRIDYLFKSQVSPATVRSSLSATIAKIGEFPFLTDGQAQQFNSEVFKLLNFHFERQYDAIVPLYQMESNVEIPLANAVLYPGGRNSELARIANDDTNRMDDNDRTQIENCSYLKFRVTGDPDSQMVQVNEEVNKALLVLRYIALWSTEKGIVVFPAHSVSMRQFSGRTILFRDVSTLEKIVSSNMDVPRGLLHVRSINNARLEDARTYSKLDDINFHIQNAERFPVSKRVSRALNFFDVAKQTFNNDVAISNYVISLDSLLPSGKNKEELTRYIKILIEHENIYVGTMKNNGNITEREHWSNAVHLTTKDYKKYYRIRSLILHGNDLTYIRFSDAEVNNALQIAHNTIRAYAHIARDLQWKTEDDAKQWFEKMDESSNESPHLCKM